ncbi:MAG TPA: glutamine-hydrolyzing GMP synthase [Candidatus Binataceae bacterium]|jgi:GMP synthase (glutamine-hydrolysing)|nr:glutamine-hydrolyzing GMP synthase [Candidatus Binataceae bacterium]
MILILDFGSQYTQLIARRVREANVYCEIHPFNFPLDKIRALKPRGIILSGGPASLYEENAPDVDPEVLKTDAPILGICYGMYVVATHLGAKTPPSRAREYGPALLHIDAQDPLFEGLDGQEHRVWMSHGDRVEDLPRGLCAIAHSENSPYAAVRTVDGRMRGIQFHPEVVHTPCGTQVLRNFVHRICGEPGDWTMTNFVDTKVAEIRALVGPDDGVVMGLSGGVDSSVAAALIHRAVGDRLHCVFVDTALLRAGERQRMEAVFAGQLGIALTVADASQLFLERLAGVTDPEQKRRIIGHTFIEVFEQQAKALGGARFLGQGTLYPDVIESVSFKGPSATIKSHHNVGGLPETMRFELIEPLRELFKDEVRQLGRQLGLPADVVDREPFPGPGLAIRIVGEVTGDRLELLRRADQIVMDETRAAGLHKRLWQSFAVLLPLKTVGVMGDGRTYESVLAIRAVESSDGMTADWARLDPAVLARLSSRITNEIRGINRVVYDITSKPPATIEWE